jgi:hypothetical protein
MKAFLQMIIARFKEPSSWAGIATLLMAAGLNIDSELWQAIVLTGTGAAGILAVVVKEKPQA